MGDNPDTGNMPPVEDPTPVQEPVVPIDPVYTGKIITGGAYLRTTYFNL